MLSTTSACPRAALRARLAAARVRATGAGRVVPPRTGRSHTSTLRRALSSASPAAPAPAAAGVSLQDVAVALASNTWRARRDELRNLEQAAASSLTAAYASNQDAAHLARALLLRPKITAEELANPARFAGVTYEEMAGVDERERVQLQREQDAAEELERRRAAAALDDSVEEPAHAAAVAAASAAAPAPTDSLFNDLVAASPRDAAHAGSKTAVSVATPATGAAPTPAAVPDVVFSAASDVTPRVATPATRVVATMWMNTVASYLEAAATRVASYTLPANAAAAFAKLSSVRAVDDVLTALSTVPLKPLSAAQQQLVQSLSAEQLDAFTTALALFRRGVVTSVASPTNSGSSEARAAVLRNVAAVLRSTAAASEFPSALQLHNTLAVAASAPSTPMLHFLRSRSAAAATVARLSEFIAREEAALNATLGAAGVSSGAKASVATEAALTGQLPAVAAELGLKGALGFTDVRITAALPGVLTVTPAGAAAAPVQVPVDVTASSLTDYMTRLAVGHIPTIVAPLARVLTPAELAAVQTLAVICAPAPSGFIAPAAASSDAAASSLVAAAAVGAAAPSGSLMQQQIESLLTSRSARRLQAAEVDTTAQVEAAFEELTKAVSSSADGSNLVQRLRAQLDFTKKGIAAGAFVGQEAAFLGMIAAAADAALLTNGSSGMQLLPPMFQQLMRNAGVTPADLTNSAARASMASLLSDTQEALRSQASASLDVLALPLDSALAQPMLAALPDLSPAAVVPVGGDVLSSVQSLPRVSQFYPAPASATVAVLPAELNVPAVRARGPVASAERVLFDDELVGAAVEAASASSDMDSVAKKLASVDAAEEAEEAAAGSDATSAPLFVGAVPRSSAGAKPTLPNMAAVRSARAEDIYNAAYREARRRGERIVSPELLKEAELELTGTVAPSDADVVAEEWQEYDYLAAEDYRSDAAYQPVHLRVLEAMEARDLDAVWTLFNEHKRLKDLQGEPDFLLYELVMDACAAAGRFDLVRHVLWPEINALHMVATDNMHFLMLKAAALSRDFDRAKALFESARREAARQSRRLARDFYVAYIHAALEAAEWNVAVDTFNAMKRARVEPTPEVYSMLAAKLAAAGRAEEVHYVWRSLSGSPALAVPAWLYTQLICTFAAQGNLTDMAAAAARMSRRVDGHQKPEPLALGAMFSAYANAGQYGDALDTRFALQAAVDADTTTLSCLQTAVPTSALNSQEARADGVPPIAAVRAVSAALGAARFQETPSALLERVASDVRSFPAAAITASESSAARLFASTDASPAAAAKASSAARSAAAAYAEAGEFGGDAELRLAEAGSGDEAPSVLAPLVTASMNRAARRAGASQQRRSPAAAAAARAAEHDAGLAGTPSQLK